MKTILIFSGSLIIISSLLIIFHIHQTNEWNIRCNSLNWCHYRLPRAKLLHTLPYFPSFSNTLFPLSSHVVCIFWNRGNNIFNKLFTYHLHSDWCSDFLFTLFHTYLMAFSSMEIVLYCIPLLWKAYLFNISVMAYKNKLFLINHFLWYIMDN